MVREIAAVLEVKNKDLAYCYPELADIFHHFDESEEVDFESMREVLYFLREELKEWEKDSRESETPVKP